MRTRILILLIAGALLSGCDLEGGAPDLDLGATADALAARSAQAKAEREAVIRAQTSTAAAIARAATVEARATKAAESARTATAMAYTFALTTAADELALAERRAQATATYDAGQIVAALQRQQATATASALERQEQQAVRDAENARRSSDFFALVVPGAVVLAIVLISWGAALYYRQALEARRLRLSVLESRAGTVVFVREGNTHTAQLLMPPCAVPDYDAPTEARTADVVESIVVHHAHGTTAIPKHDARDPKQEADRRLALRLLRESLQRVGAQSDRVPPAKALGWRAETWVRAVALLKPHVITRQGRSGGTFCAEPFATLGQLYAAVGERRITPLPSCEGAADPGPERAERMGT